MAVQAGGGGYTKPPKTLPVPRGRPRTVAPKPYNVLTSGNRTGKPASTSTGNAGTEAGYTGTTGGVYGDWSGSSLFIDQPTAAQAPGGLEADRAQALKDALAAIGAQFAFERGNLTTQLGSLGNQWTMRNLEIEQQREDERRKMLEVMVQRGIAKSTLTAQGYTDIEEQVQKAKGQNLQQFGTKETAGEHGTAAQQLQSAIELIVKQRAAAEQQARARAAAGELDLESLLELIGTGVAGSGMAA